jgi:hypothetical protein
MGLYWNVIVLLRWTLTSIILVLLRDFYCLQIQSFFLISLFTQVAIVSGRPMDGEFENEIALFNEVMVCFYLYIMMTLTDFNHDQYLRNECSICLAVIVLLSASLNFVKFLVLISKALYSTLKIRYLKYKQDQLIALHKLNQKQEIRETEDLLTKHKTLITDVLMEESAFQLGLKVIIESEPATQREKPLTR